MNNLKNRQKGNRCGCKFQSSIQYNVIQILKATIQYFKIPLNHQRNDMIRFDLIAFDRYATDFCSELTVKVH